jgi:hypothetical protein
MCIFLYICNIEFDLVARVLAPVVMSTCTHDIVKYEKRLAVLKFRADSTASTSKCAQSAAESRNVIPRLLPLRGVHHGRPIVSKVVFEIVDF